MTRARSVAEVIAGEAVSGTPEQRMADMMAIASVISNRAALLGVTPEQVVANSNEFNAYNRPLPPGVGSDIVAMAQEAVDTVAVNGPTNNATFYATPAAADNLPGALSFETSTDGHQFFSDPLGRAIGTSEGYIQPNQYSYAANIEDVPTPAKNPSSIPTENPAFMAGAPLAEVDPNLALAVPDAITNLPAAELATAQSFERAAPATNPWGGAPMPSLTASGVLSGTAPMQAAASTQNNGVMAGLQSDGYSQMAAAGPMGGDYASPADRFSPSPGIMSGLPNGQQITQADVARGLFNATADGQMDPAFTEAMMSAENPVVPMAVETQTFTPEAQATDVASQPADLGSMPDAYAAQRQAPTGLNSAEMQAMQGHVAYAAQKAREDQQLNSFPSVLAATPSLSVPASGVLAGVPGMEAQTAAQVSALNSGVMANPAMATPNFNQAVNPSLPSLASTPVGPSQYQMQEIAQAGQIPGVIAAGMTPSAVTAYADEPASAPAVDAIEAQTVPGITTPSVDALASAEQQAAGYQQAAQSLRTAGIMNIGQQPPTDFSGNLPTNFDVLGQDPNVVAAPDLETIEIADQPTVSNTIEGPATTPAVDQQAQVDAKTAITAPTTTTKTAPTATDKGVMSGLFSKEALGGGVLAGLLGGPMAAPLGVLAGTAIANGGGLTGLLSTPSFSQPTSQIAGGVNNISGIYNGAQPAGTYAVANNGATITAQPGGYSTYTNKYGVTEAVGPDGKISGYFGSGAQPQDQDQTASTSSGGFFGGLFS